MRLITWPLWWLGTLASALAGVLFGFMPAHLTWFRVPSTTDRWESAGGYTAAAVILLAAVTAMEAWEGPRSARRFGLFAAALFTFMALRAALVLPGSATPDASEAFWEGATRTLSFPTTWFDLVAGLIGWALIVWRNVRTRDRAEALSPALA